MTEENKSRSRAPLQLGLISAVFGVPLILAAWMYYGGALTPSSASNNGDLLQPIVSLSTELPASPLHKSAPDQWLMLYMNRADCAADCREALHRLRQSRLMLGNDMTRVARIFLHGDSPPDTVFLSEQHAGLITIADNRLATLLEAKRPADSRAGGCYLIDPLGNLVMYFSPDLNPKAMVDDIEHLLKLSRIG